MTFPSNISALAIAVSTLVSTVAFADDSFRQHDAHVHGVVELNIAQDGNDLLLEITAPGSDIVGFEHAPKNQEQIQAIQQAMLTLKKSSSLFEINSDANCELTDSYVNQSLSKNGDDHRNHDDHDHSNHDDHDHSSHDDHDHGSHDDHDHSSHDDHDHSEHANKHGEFSAQYSFSCKNIAQLNEIKLNWFNHFPSTEKISVQAITDKSQQANQLSKNNATLKF
ncbi:zinc uptake protein ZrgA [Photobacterium indicum]|uniref:zinc uptake protein ZrgA n=1 Tax=Photobacterium indicum TaxID=81447 RepID=UPI003D0E2C2F